MSRLFGPYILVYFSFLRTFSVRKRYEANNIVEVISNENTGGVAGANNFVCNLIVSYKSETWMKESRKLNFDVKYIYIYIHIYIDRIRYEIIKTSTKLARQKLYNYQGEIFVITSAIAFNSPFTI